MFSQCCGYDLVKRYAGQLVPIATPHYGVPSAKVVTMPVSLSFARTMRRTMS